MSRYGIWARRSGGSVFGPAEAWCKDADGEYMVLDTQEEANKVAERYRKSMTSPHLQYFPKEMDQEMAEGIQLCREQARVQEPGPGMKMGDL